jgi:hypothetical protein
LPFALVGGGEAGYEQSDGLLELFSYLLLLFILGHITYPKEVDRHLRRRCGQWYLFCSVSFDDSNEKAEDVSWYKIGTCGYYASGCR